MHTNRLAQETSPYLQQHAHNPVDWYPWGPEAFERARREDRPIFLSAGYSTCYWCHVMERQCFEVEAIATVMNELFVCVKLDREERPDVDQLYMTAVQVQTRHGGWPMSVFLTPDLQYFYGGTYFPPSDSYGRPGFVSLMRAIADAWNKRRDEVLRSAKQYTKILQQVATVPRPEESRMFDATELVRLIDRSTVDFDGVHGGFGRSPKFPRQTLLQLLLNTIAAPSPVDHNIASLRTKGESQLRRTLDAMMYGGIRDQLAGGFHRYSTDAQWIVPHFEIMLYDNAMLGGIYAQAAHVFDDRRYAVAAGELIDFVLSDLASPEGAFFAAIDAEVDAQEGLSYLWTPDEVRMILSKEFTPAEVGLFLRVFGLANGFNFSDPHHGTGPADKNILYVSEPSAYHEPFDRLLQMRRALLAERRLRKQPMTDTKIITSWNALMIAALADASQALDEPGYLAAAERAAGVLLTAHRTTDGGLYRTSRNGKPRHDGVLKDYACLAKALLRLHAATRKESWRQAALDITAQMKRRFPDPADGGFFFTDANCNDLILRQKTAVDSPLPSGNAVAADVLLQLGETTAAASLLSVFAESLHQQAESMSAMVSAALNYVNVAGPLIVNPSGQQAGTVETVDPVSVTARRTEFGAIVQLDIAAGWHINANLAGPGMVGLLVESEPRWTTVTYPPSQAIAAAGVEAIPVYSGKIEVEMLSPARINRCAVTYQACDHQRCLAPVRKDVALDR